MSKVHEAVDGLILVIKESDEYINYETQLERVKQENGLKEQIDIFRKRNYELQRSEDIAYDKIDAFEREYESFCENPLVSDFLSAELAFCRMMQEINYKLTDAVDFE